MPGAAPLPGNEAQLDTIVRIALEDGLEAFRHPGIVNAERDFVVDLERAIVEIARADRAPDAVDGDHLLMEQRLLIFEDAHAGGEQAFEL